MKPILGHSDQWIFKLSKIRLPAIYRSVGFPIVPIKNESHFRIFIVLLPQRSWEKNIQKIKNWAQGIKIL